MASQENFKPIYYKTKQEIEQIRESGVILGKAHGEVAKLIKPGITTKILDQRAEEFIRDNKAYPSFLNYKGENSSFPASLCISVNETVVHGFPSNYELKEGDIVSIDCGVFYNGFHADSAFTYPIGEVNEKVMDLLRATKKSLELAILEVAVGKRIGDISFTIQKYVQEKGFTVVRELVGHGVGRSLHEKPEVPNYGLRGRGSMIQNGLVLAIEPMINMGKRDVVQEADGWTIRTRDRKPSAHYEHTVAFYNGKADVLTTFEYIEEYFKI